VGKNGAPAIQAILQIERSLLNLQGCTALANARTLVDHFSLFPQQERLVLRGG
jgi:hypothetical protein